MPLPKQDLTSLFVDLGCDWSSKSIIAALDKKGTTLKALGAELGVKESAIRNVFYRPCRRYEEMICQRIGVGLEVIWPSRHLNNLKGTV